MAVKEPLLERILEEAEGLSPQDRVRLIQRLKEKFLPAEIPDAPREHRPLEYGKYKGQWETTEEDFKRAEWGLDKLAQLEEELYGE